MSSTLGKFVAEVGKDSVDWSDVGEFPSVPLKSLYLSKILVSFWSKSEPLKYLKLSAAGSSKALI